MLRLLYRVVEKFANSFWKTRVSSHRSLLMSIWAYQLCPMVFGIIWVWDRKWNWCCVTWCSVLRVCLIAKGSLHCSCHRMFARMIWQEQKNVTFSLSNGYENNRQEVLFTRFFFFSSCVQFFTLLYSVPAAECAWKDRTVNVHAGCVKTCSCLVRIE